MWNYVILLLVVFIGYALGRLGHILSGQLPGPHHWLIPGLLLIILGVIFDKFLLSRYMICFGLGQIISDLDDMLHFRIWGRDPKDAGKKFWDIN